MHDDPLMSLIPLMTQNGVTALMLAAYSGNEGCVRLLVEAGADRTLKATASSWKGKTALDLASTDAIKAILRG